MTHKSLKLLLKIPSGKITTYAELARVCDSSPRGIGSVMRTNKHPEIYPCYKVVCSDGSVGGYSGKKSKKKLILADSIPVVGNRIPHFEKYVFRFKNK